MSLFRNKKRNEFYNDLIKVNFKDIKVDENNIDIKSVLDQIKEETKKILTAIENWRENKTHKDTDDYGTYLKSKSQEKLKDIKNACEEIDKMNITSFASTKNKVKPVVLTKIDELDKILLKPILTLKSELKRAATANFSLLTFGAVLDDRKNKKRLAEISRDIEILWNKLKNAKEKIEEKKSKIVIGSNREQKKDPGIFKGLPNDNNYCYLNTALQNLYHNSSFRKKILSYNTKTTEMQEVERQIENKNNNIINLVRKLMPAEIDDDSVERTGGNNIETEQKRNAYKAILYATQFFFKYLNNEIDNNKFGKSRKNMAYFLGYDGKQRSSSIIQQKIEKACTYVMNPKQRLGKNHNNDANFTDFIDSTQQWKNNASLKEATATNIAEIEIYLKHLYNEDKNLRETLLNLQDEDFYLKDHEKIKTIKTIFQMFKENKFNKNEDTFKLLQSIGNEPTLNGLRKTILKGIKEIAYSKEPKLLTRDSNITLNNVNIKKDLVLCIESIIDHIRNENNAPYRLPLKDNKFTVTFADRTGGRRTGFTAEEEIDLAELAKNKKLVIFSNGKELDKNKTKFKLVSATIGTGGHYYLYVKKDSTWHCLDDGTHKENVSWKNIQKDINTMCETLTYKLI